MATALEKVLDDIPDEPVPTRRGMTPGRAGAASRLDTERYVTLRGRERGPTASRDSFRYHFASSSVVPRSPRAPGLILVVLLVPAFARPVLALLGRGGR